MPDTAQARAALVEQQALRDILDRYEAASEKLDVASLQEIWPSLTDKQIKRLKDAFANYQSQSMDITMGQITTRGTTAEIRARVRRVIQPKVGRQVADEREMVIVLRKRGSGWVIEDLR